MDSSATAFDAEELKHLAIKAMRADREEDALRLIKAALAQKPHEPELLYLLGMVHSNLGMTNRAIEELSQVLALAPELINCRFQLGLLHFTRRAFKQAESVWAPLLSALSEDDPLRVFATGLTQVGNDRIEEAIPVLERGISLSGNAFLNEDMGRILTECQRHLAQTSGPTSKSRPGTAPVTNSSQHVLLSGYRKPS
jgi:tetratricopeptide (TPR) repeat protein